MGIPRTARMMCSVRTRRIGLRLLTRAGVLALVAATLGCGSSEKEEVSFLEGEVLYQGESQHDVPLLSDSIVEVALDSGEALLVTEDGDVPGAFPVVLGVRIGTREADGTCTPETQFNFRPGDSFFFSLRQGTHCIDLYDSGGVPETGKVRYTLRVVVKT